MTLGSTYNPLRTIANGVVTHDGIFCPFRARSGVVPASQSELIVPPRASTDRVYIDRIVLQGYIGNPVGIAPLGPYVLNAVGKQDRELITLTTLIIPAVSSGAGSLVRGTLHVSLDVGESLYLTGSSYAPDSNNVVRWSAIYAEIPGV